MSKQNIHHAVYPILFTTAILGLSSIFPKTRTLKIFNLLRILNVFYITVYSYLIYTALFDMKNQELRAQYAFGVSKIGIIFQLLAQITLTYIIYFANISNSPKILSSIDDIRKIDAMFLDLGEHLNYNRHCTHETIAILIGLAAIFGRSVITHVYMSRSIFSTDDAPHLILSFPAFVSYLVQMQFALLVRLVHERFGLINRLLENSTDEKIAKNFVKPSKEFHPKHAIRRVETLMELHDRLTDVGNKLNESFSVQILSCLTAQFLTEVFTIFYVYYESLILKNKTSALIWSIWTLWTALEILYVTRTCHSTCTESKLTGTVIHKMLMIENEPHTKRKLMIFSQQVRHRPLQFTACGLFSIDTTLIFTISGAAATYLLIMLQFQEGIEAQCSNLTVYKMF